MQRNTRIAAALSALALAGTAIVLAGPLDPPAGAVSSTYKTLSEVEPRIAVNAKNTPGSNGDQVPSLFKITQPGSYYLTGNISVPAGKAGIVITCSDVTLDLGGFTIAGGIAGVFADPILGAEKSVTVRNGHVRGGASVGVHVTASGAVVEGVTAKDAGGYGISLGDGAIVTGCVATGNADGGISADSGATMRDCQANENGWHGIYAGAGSVFEGCVFSNNVKYGLFCDTATITNCAALDNGGHGFAILNGSTITGCTARRSGEYGIAAGGKCVVRDCTASDNIQHGIEVWQYSVAEGCTTHANGLHGIKVGSYSFVSRCVSHENGTAGVGAGVYASGPGNRIEDNNCTHNDYGLDVDSQENFIARNSARGNASGNFSVVANNELAPVVTNPGSNGFATMTAWSNVAY